MAMLFTEREIWGETDLGNGRFHFRCVYSERLVEPPVRGRVGIWMEGYGAEGSGLGCETDLGVGVQVVIGE